MKFKIMHFILNDPKAIGTNVNTLLLSEDILPLLPAEVFAHDIAYILEITKDPETGEYVVQYGDDSGNLLCSEDSSILAEATAKMLISLSESPSISLGE